jgi:hypothetical protein
VKTAERCGGVPLQVFDSEKDGILEHGTDAFIGRRIELARMDEQFRTLLPLPYLVACGDSSKPDFQPRSTRLAYSFQAHLISQTCKQRRRGKTKKSLQVEAGRSLGNDVKKTLFPRHNLDSSCGQITSRSHRSARLIIGSSPHAQAFKQLHLSTVRSHRSDRSPQPPAPHSSTLAPFA